MNARILPIRDPPAAAPPPSEAYPARARVPAALLGWLAGLDSSQDSEIQSLPCYRLHHRAVTEGYSRRPRARIVLTPARSSGAGGRARRPRCALGRPRAEVRSARA